MLSRIIKIINNSNYYIEDGTIFCNNYSIEDIECIDFLEAENIFENFISTKEVGNKIDLELSLAKLNTLGFYENSETFILKNKYKEPTFLYYIEELKCFSSDTNDFFVKYRSIINLIDSIKEIAKHTYSNTGIDNSIIFREDKSIFIPLIYNNTIISQLNINEINKLNSLTSSFKEEDNEKKLLFINELIEYLIGKNEESKFEFLLLHFNEFYEKCNNAYQFYLSDFSYNKLKIELDSKALEYTQKIQSVINDSQTKLIAIPTAFVLIFVAFDYDNLLSVKNIASIIGLLIFSTIIQLFLNNQKSTLNFIWENILAYKETFKENNIENISNKFSLVEYEFDKQKKRLKIVEILLWTIPVLLICLCIALFSFEMILKILGVTLIIIILLLKIILG